MKLLPLILLLTGCGTTAHLTTAFDWHGRIEGGNPIMVFTVEKPVTDTINCGYMHISHLRAGRPFNNRKEDTADAIQCTAEIW